MHQAHDSGDRSLQECCEQNWLRINPPYSLGPAGLGQHGQVEGRARMQHSTTMVLTRLILIFNMDLMELFCVPHSALSPPHGVRVGQKLPPPIN